MVKIRFTARSPRAEALFRKYKDSKDKRIKGLQVVSEKPLMIDVEPRLNAVYRKAINMAFKRPEMQQQIMESVRKEYTKAMMAEGLGPTEYDLVVTV